MLEDNNLPQRIADLAMYIIDFRFWGYMLTVIKHETQIMTY